jgi:hypothetical protein
MEKSISLSDFSVDDKILLLKELGFNSDGEFVLNDKKERVFDKYLDISIKINNMLILPGSTIILDDNEYSLMRYMQEYENLE